VLKASQSVYSSSSYYERPCEQFTKVKEELVEFTPILITQYIGRALLNKRLFGILKIFDTCYVWENSLPWED